MQIFNINITNRIEITSNYNFDRELDVQVCNSFDVELYRTRFLFSKGILFWIALSQLKNIKINILDQNDIIYSHNNINRDFLYVTCGDLYYMDLIEKLVVSLLNVSDQKIIVYGINCKVPFDYPNLIKREFFTPVLTPHDKWFWKQQVCIEALKENYDNFVWVDGDIIANVNIDTISKYFPDIENYPLGEIHVQDEQIYYRNGRGEVLGERICQYFGINRKILPKDLHACFFIYNHNCKWFFEEILNLYHSIYDQGLYDELLGWNDESLHNFMHSKYNFTKTLPLSNLALLCEHSKYVSNPKVLRLFYGYWNEDSPNNFGEIFGWSYVPKDKEQILYFHENKNLKDADEMIEFVKMKKFNSFNNSKWFYVDKHKIHNFEKERLNNELNSKYDECKLFEHKELLNILPDDIVLDIGADIGFFERYCYLKYAEKIICFEPNKEKFELLKLNASDNTILFNADISDNVGEYIIETEHKDIVVDTYTIDYLFEAELVNNIDLIKIDNKGKERQILNGLNNNNLHKINKISIKWYDFIKYDNVEQNDIVNHYLSFGFNCWVNSEVDYTRLYFYRPNIKKKTLVMDNEVKINLRDIFYGHDKIKYRDVPIAKCPFDYVMYQMIINEIKPDLIIEIGTSEGGSALYMADILDIIGKGIIHTIDIKEKINAELFNNHKRIRYFNQGFQNYDLSNANGFEKVLVIDDGTHSHGHVLQSLNKFKHVVSAGSYFIIEDGIIDELLKDKIFDQDYWGGGPLRAIEEFLKSNKDFEIDRKWCDFFGKNNTFNVNGFLKKIK